MNTLHIKTAEDERMEECLVLQECLSPDALIALLHLSQRTNLSPVELLDTLIMRLNKKFPPTAPTH